MTTKPNILVLLLSSVIAAACRARGADFSLPGPCTTNSTNLTFTVPDGLQPSSLPAKLSLNITIPSCTLDPADLPFGSQGGLPVLFFMNGFKNFAAWYHLLIHQVASWGLVTVQYDTPVFSIVTVADELKLFPHLVKWVADQAEDPASPLHNLVDMKRAAIGGHSRGGKLATLAFAGNPDLVKAAYLVDPVDATLFTPVSPDYPSAVDALAKSGLPVGMSGAGVIFWCNPKGSGYQAFYPAAANGSWLGFIPETGHGQFVEAGSLINAAIDGLCRKGSDNRRQVAELTATPMLAWLWDQLVGQGRPLEEQQQANAAGNTAGSSPLPAFISWLGRQQEAGLLEFQVKGDEADIDGTCDGVGVTAGPFAPGQRLTGLQQCRRR